MPLGGQSLIGIAGSINQEIKAMAKQINVLLIMGGHPFSPLNLSELFLKNCSPTTTIPLTQMCWLELLNP